MSAAPKKWENEPGLFDYAKSHWNDPETSRQAAESISPERISETQRRVIAVFRFNGGEMCDERLVELYLDYWPESATDQSIRSRRGELVRKGLLYDTAKRELTKYGRGCVVWRLTS